MEQKRTSRQVGSARRLQSSSLCNIIGISEAISRVSLKVERNYQLVQLHAATSSGIWQTYTSSIIAGVSLLCDPEKRPLRPVGSRAGSVSFFSLLHSISLLFSLPISFSFSRRSLFSLIQLERGSKVALAIFSPLFFGAQRIYPLRVTLTEKHLLYLQCRREKRDEEKIAFKKREGPTLSSSNGWTKHSHLNSWSE